MLHFRDDLGPVIIVSGFLLNTKEYADVMRELPRVSPQVKQQSEEWLEKGGGWQEAC